MSTNRGKQWETKIREDFKRTFPTGTIDKKPFYGNDIEMFKSLGWGCLKDEQRKTI